jgi:hypothetical protein
MSRSADTVLSKQASGLGTRIAHLALVAIAGLLLGQCVPQKEEAPPGPPALVANAPVTIMGGQPNPKKIPVSRGNRDKVQWVNNDDVGYTLEFAYEGWPFEDPPQSVMVPAKDRSKVFTVWHQVDKGPYSYRMRKAGLAAATQAAQGPPDPPQVNVGD